MAANTITRGQLLLQYLTALSELEAEAGAGDDNYAGMRFHGAVPMFWEDSVAARASAA